MTPTITDAEVEAAATAIVAEMFAPHELPISDEIWNKYRRVASAAFTAAAQAREKEVMPLEQAVGLHERTTPISDTPPGPAPDTQGRAKIANREALLKIAADSIATLERQLAEAREIIKRVAARGVNHGIMQRVDEWLKANGGEK